jgi:hypothetical protein
VPLLSAVTTAGAREGGISSPRRKLTWPELVEKTKNWRAHPGRGATLPAMGPAEPGRQVRQIDLRGAFTPDV